MIGPDEGGLWTVCLVCGAVVADSTKHDEYHAGDGGESEI